MDKDKIRKLDQDELEMVTGGKMIDSFPGIRRFFGTDETENKNNTNNASQGLRKNRPEIFKA